MKGNRPAIVLSLNDTAELARRVLRGLTADGALSTFAGATVITVFLQWLTFGSGVSDRNSRISLAIAAGYGLVASAVGLWRFRRVVPRAMAWLDTGRRPTAEERMAALALPARMAVQFFEAFAGAAILFGVLNATAFHNPATRSVQVAGTITLGGLTTCMTFFLMGERRMRPVFALALAGEPPVRPATIGIRPRLVLSWALGSGVVLLGLVLVPLATQHHRRPHLVGWTIFAGSRTLRGRGQPTELFAPAGPSRNEGAGAGHRYPRSTRTR